MCPQANSSSILLGGIVQGEAKLDEMAAVEIKSRRTIAGYIYERINSPYSSPKVGADYLTHVSSINESVPPNVYLVVGDEELEMQASRVARATIPGPDDAWHKVHLWIREIIHDIKYSWNLSDSTVFIDCNPSFTIYTELALSASDRLIIPFTADGSSKRAVRAVLALVYGVRRTSGGSHSEYYLNSMANNLGRPLIYCYVGSRLTQMNKGSASAFRAVVSDIETEIWNVWNSQKGNQFCVHAFGGMPSNRADFRKMFQAEIVDAHSSAVVSGALGIPLVKLTSAPYNSSGIKLPAVNISQLDKQQPNLRDFVKTIE